jgi:hypothetical protein
MKKIILLLSLSTMLFASCAEDDAAPVSNNNEANIENKVLMLKVDLQTHQFEGGKELVFPEAEGFTITTDYVSPGDFGSIKLNYAEVEQPIFDGTITWMGLGERSYPENIDPADSFTVIEDGVAMPELSDFELVDYGEGAGVADQWVDHQSIWAAIDNLQQVQAYRQSNPDAKVHLFLYTPSVGIGDPADWDWYVILKD